MQVIRFFSNWIILLTAPIWLPPAVAVAALLEIYYNPDVREAMLGKCWLWD